MTKPVTMKGSEALFSFVGLKGLGPAWPRFFAKRVLAKSVAIFREIKSGRTENRARAARPGGSSLIGVKWNWVALAKKGSRFPHEYVTRPTGSLAEGAL